MQEQSRGACAGCGHARFASAAVSQAASTAARPDQQSLLTKKIGRVRWGLYGSRAYLDRRGAPTSEDELADHDVAMLSEERASMPQAVWTRTHVDASRVTLSSSSIPALVEACAAGYGLAPLPRILAEPRAELVRLAIEVPDADVRYVVPRELADVARVRAVLDYLASESDRVAQLLDGVSA